VFDAETAKINKFEPTAVHYILGGFMRKFLKSCLVLGVVAAFFCMPLTNSALAEAYFKSKEPGGGAMIYDLLVIRPVGVVATALGSVFWLVSLPFSASGDNYDAATQKLVKEPAAYTFKRPLGEF
jgi:hypothetical protein